jgi:hypothetical protein
MSKVVKGQDGHYRIGDIWEGTASEDATLNWSYCNCGETDRPVLFADASFPGAYIVCALPGSDGRPFGVVADELVVQDYVEQRLVNVNSSVVIDISELAEAVHEEAYARPRGADHVGERLLGDGRDVPCEKKTPPGLRWTNRRPCPSVFRKFAVEKFGLPGDFINDPPCRTCP